MRSSDAYDKLLKGAAKLHEQALNHVRERRWPSLLLPAKIKHQEIPHRCCGYWPTDRIGPALASLILGLCALPLLVYYAARRQFPDVYHEASLLVEGLIILCIAIGNALLLIRETWLRRNELPNRLRTILSAFEGLSDAGHDFSHHYPSSRLTDSSSAPLVYVERDNSVVQVPAVLLVEGDAVFLSPGDRAPAHLRTELSAGQLYVPESYPSLKKLESEEQPFSCKPQRHACFDVLRTPLLDQLPAALGRSWARPTCMILRERTTVVRILQRICLVVYIGAVVGNALRNWYLDGEVGTWFEVVIILPIYTILPFLPIAFPLHWFVANHYAEAKLLAIFYDSVLRPKPQYDHEDDESIDSWETKAQTRSEEDVYTSAVSVWSHFVNLIIGRAGELTRSTSVFKVLGDLSVMTFVDKTGILAEPIPQPVKVFLFSDDEDPSNEDGPPSPTVHTGDTSNKAIELDLIHSHAFKPTGMAFQNNAWHNHIAALKPLGLNMLLNTECDGGAQLDLTSRFIATVDMYVRGGVSNHETQAITRLPTARHPCLCNLASEIGFAADAAADFKVHQRIVTVAPCHPTIHHQSGSESPGDALMAPTGIDPRVMKHVAVPHLTSLVVSTLDHDAMQLLSAGTAELTLDCCEDYWNGSTIVPLTPADRARVMNFYYSSSLTTKCFTFAYRPVYHALNANQTKAVYVVLPPEPDGLGTKARSTSDLRSTPELLNLETTDSTSLPDLFHPTESGNSRRARSPGPTRRPPSIVELDDRHTRIGKAAHELQSDQIFLGMVAVEDLPSDDVVPLIEDLTNAGVRFVFFSKEDELHSKAFANRIGLETGWNCFISLSDDGEGYADNTAQLPRGVGAIRSHLESIDDVPLLVPMFSDCSPAASEEMTLIMQENEKVVCCVGSALNSDNIQTFARANMSIGVVPKRSWLCSDSRQAYGPIPDLSGAEQFAAELVTLPCSFLIERDAHVSLADLICEARRLSVNLKNAFLFMIWANSFVSLLHIFALIALLPPILTGYHILWLTSVPIPLLTMSLLNSPAEPGLMRELTGLQSGRLNHIGRFVMYFLLRFVPSAIVCVILFGASLQSFCEKERGDCSISLGDRRAFGPNVWNGWSSDLLAGLKLAQGGVSWLVVLYLCVMSMSFTHRSLPLTVMKPYKNKAWVLAVIVCLLCQSGFFVLEGVFIPEQPIEYGIKDFPTGVFVAAFAWPVVIVLIDTLVRRHDHSLHLLSQKRAKLLFDTKLGMNSPV